MKRKVLSVLGITLGITACICAGLLFPSNTIQAASERATGIAINATNFPNAAFREYVKQFDKDNNGYFSSSEIKRVLTIELTDNDRVTSLKGIEYFTALTNLTVSNDALTSLDISKNTDLCILDCNNNSISSLNVSKNTQLLVLSCNGNNISTLNLSCNKDLEMLYCENNNLSSINISSNLNLIDFSISENPISTLDLSHNPKLEMLDCQSTNISTLNTSANPVLTWLSCCNCENLSSINVTKNPVLETLVASDTKLNSINVTKNYKLIFLSVNCTSVSSLNVKNNSKLETLDCGETKVSSIDLSKNTALTSLNISHTLLSSLNVSNCKKLKDLSCDSTNISSLNISNNRKLEWLSIGNTNIQTIDISTCPYLLTTFIEGIKDDFQNETIYSYYDKNVEQNYYLFLDMDMKVRTTPNALGTLSAAPAGKNAVMISWQFSGVADGYLIYGQKDKKYGYVGMTTNGKTFTDTKALSENYNFYWVFPYTKDLKGNMYVGACTKYVYSKGICPAVSNLKASSIKGGVKLTWDASAGAEGYLIYGIVDEKPYKYISMTKGTSFTDKNASSSQYNYYWVFPYFTNSNGKMIITSSGKYTYGRALK